ncbi:hypothetical protein LguiA_010672 [Lonicera macranthoides]
MPKTRTHQEVDQVLNEGGVVLEKPPINPKGGLNWETPLVDKQQIGLQNLIVLGDGQ